MPLKEKFLLGVCGGIAAYKAAELARLLVKQGYQVKTVMTEAAERFISPLTFQALTGHPVRTALFDPAAEASMGHIELARWADQIIIAPASANFIAKLAHGLADDLLSTLCLAATVPIHIAPAMNQAMWQNAATQHNIASLRLRNTRILGPDTGEQACGELGPGRMLEPTEILSRLRLNLSCEKGEQRRPHWLITAGPTREAIDPVRFLSNRSSGKMGYAIAQAAVRRGDHVTLISGPTALRAPTGDVKLVNVTSTREMLEATLSALDNEVDIFIASAAVADYRISSPAKEKIKKNDDTLELTLVKNPDILQTVGSHPKRPGYVVGFAAETNNVLEHAQKKRIQKQADLIIANDVTLPGLGFDSDDNLIHLVGKGLAQTLGPAPKHELAESLYERILAQWLNTDHTD